MVIKIRVDDKHLIKPENFLVPKIGQTVYCIDRCDYTTIVRDKVKFLGKTAFITNNFGNDYNDSCYFQSYGEYGIEWFTNLSDARTYLKNYWQGMPGYEDHVLRKSKYYDDVWEIEVK